MCWYINLTLCLGPDFQTLSFRLHIFQSLRDMHVQKWYHVTAACGAAVVRETGQLVLQIPVKDVKWCLLQYGDIITRPFFQSSHYRKSIACPHSLPMRARNGFSIVSLTSDFKFCYSRCRGVCKTSTLIHARTWKRKPWWVIIPSKYQVTLIYRECWLLLFHWDESICVITHIICIKSQQWALQHTRDICLTHTDILTASSTNGSQLSFILILKKCIVQISLVEHCFIRINSSVFTSQ